MSGPDQDERDRVRSYLLSQAEKYGWLELWPRIVEGRLAFLEAIRGVGEPQGDFRPDEGAWTIREIAHHVLLGSRAVAVTIERLGVGEPADQVHWADPAHAPAVESLAELRHEILADSVAFSNLATRFPDNVSLEPTAPHDMFGQLHCRGWFMFQRVHDQDHARQVQAIKDAPGYPA
ncbi:MAG: DinB superfamily protein [Chloroflexi bacterium]|jgi:hypothetical protein|nr:MAG: DinB superfamily protein [Chloroflexota bacterium]